MREADDGEFVYLTNDEDYSFTGADRNWKACSVDLSQFNGSNNIRIGFDGYTSAYDEPPYARQRLAERYGWCRPDG